MLDGNIVQIGQVVKDADKTMKALAEDFGFGPFDVHIFNDRKVKDSMVHGKPSAHTYVCAATWNGSVQFELMQPLVGRSIYDEFMEKHRGEGLQHFKLYYRDAPGAVESYAKKGYIVNQSGSIGEDLFYYLDSENKTFGVTVELGNSASIPPPDRIYPEAPIPGKKIQTGWENRMEDGDLMQIGHLVKDLDQAMLVMNRDFGIGPFEVYEFTEKTKKDFRVRGQPSDATFVVACAWSGGIQYELIQSLSGKTVYDEFMDAHGEGLHHIKLYYRDVETKVKEFEEKGYKVIQSGGIGNDLFYYLDSAERLSGLIIEIGNTGDASPAARVYPPGPQ